MIDGMPVAEFIHRNADPAWLHENEVGASIGADQGDEPAPPRKSGSFPPVPAPGDEEAGLPF